MEIKLSDFGDGGAITSSGGDVDQDGGFLTAIYISLFGGDNFYNIYSDYPQDKSFEDAIQAPITVPNLNAAEKAAKNLLKWMIDEGVVESIAVRAYGNNDNKMNVDITTTEPGGDSKLFGVVWQNEKAILKAK